LHQVYVIDDFEEENQRFLCPACYNVYQRLLSEFFEGKHSKSIAEIQSRLDVERKKADDLNRYIFTRPEYQEQIKLVELLEWVLK